MSKRADYIAEIRALAAEDISNATIRWQSPSNIALVKYWGKHGIQLPMNPSVSFTLSRSLSDTCMYFDKKNGPSTTVDLSFFLDKEAAPEFESRIKDYFESISDLCPFLTQYNIKIESSNSFPHSAGIASSASGFSALALCIATMEDQLYGNLDDDARFREKASFLARLGSGSACRSIYDQMAWWGTSDELATASDDYAVSAADWLHPSFLGFQDSILIVSAEKKPVSSSHGHGLMDFHPYRHGRMNQVQHHLRELKSALKIGDLERFGQIVENEAISLHALMMSSSPGYFLINGQSIRAMQAIRSFRASEKIPCYFTLDAGPNIHLLYPKSHSAVIKDFITDELDEFTDRIIFDEMGNGPVQIS